MKERDDDGTEEKEKDESDGSPGKIDSALFRERIAGSRQVLCVVCVCVSMYERRMQRGICCYWESMNVTMIIMPQRKEKRELFAAVGCVCVQCIEAHGSNGIETGEKRRKKKGCKERLTERAHSKRRS